MKCINVRRWIRLETYTTILLRVGLTFMVLLFFTRLTGKKELSQSTFFDFITAIAIGDIAAEKLSSPDHPLGPWLAATTLWFGLTIGMDILVLQNRRLAKILEGEPTLLIENGRILEKNLRRARLQIDDLMAHLRAQGYFNPNEIEFAIFETAGRVSVLPKSQYRPVQPRDLSIPTQYEGTSREVVVDGKVVSANLSDMGLTRDWLMQELQRAGYSDPAGVFYASLDTQGKLYVDGYDDPVAGSRLRIEDTV